MTRTVVSEPSAPDHLAALILLITGGFAVVITSLGVLARCSAR